MEGHEEGHCQVCSSLRFVPESEGRASKASWIAEAIFYLSVFRTHASNNARLVSDGDTRGHKIYTGSG